MKRAWLVILLAMVPLACSTMRTSVDYDRSIGTLIVDLVDTERKDLVWRGKATDTIGSDSEAREQQLREAVSKMFEGFPASRGGK